MEETMKCEACGGDIQDGVCLACGAMVGGETSGEEMGSNIEASEEVVEETPAEEEAAA